MPRGKTSGGKPPKRPIERYEHTDKKRINNPPVGLVTPDTDPVAPTHKTYDYVVPVPSVKPRQELDYDPHLDPQLVWAGKKEHSSFEVPTVSLHVHERIDPHTIMEAVRKRNGTALPVQASLFERREENPPLREAIDFYRHAHGWSNRLIAGDSLLVMNSLLEKEGMAGQVQVVYIDPPDGVKYGSNFQPFVNKREVKDGKDEDLTQEPETVRAYSRHMGTWNSLISWVSTEPSLGSSRLTERKGLGLCTNR
jgi:adenine-specific DNA-methyltransferase